MFVPPTPGGRLAKQMQIREAQLNFGSNHQIKIVGKSGIKLKNILVQKNPYPKLLCHRNMCPFCKITPVSTPAPSRLHCTNPSVGYTITCLFCKSNNHQARYEGETGRPAVTRGIEHVKQLFSSKPDNPMVKHVALQHPAEAKQVRFEFGLTRKFRDPLTRQADEGLRIFKTPNSATILNSKAEFNHPKLARVGIIK